MRKFSCFLTVFVMSSFSLSSRSVVEGMLRLRRSGMSSKYIYRAGGKGETTTVSSEPDICKVPDDDSSNSRRTKRTILYSIPNTTTTTKTPEDEIDISILSPQFLNCTHVNIEPGCYVKFSNDTVFVPRYNMIFDRANYVIRQRLLFICPDIYRNFTEDAKFSSNLETVTTVCVSISMACIILHVIMFILVKRLRNLPGYILLSLCIALKNAYICSFIQNSMPEDSDCTVIGMFLLYFFLASFFWMNAMSYDVWQSIRMATVSLRLSTDRPLMVRFCRYSLYAWGIPLLIVISSIIIHNTSSNIKYKLIFNVDTCWFEYKQALTLYFAVPLFIILGMNMIFFVSSFCMISQASMGGSQSGPNSSSDLRSRLFLSLRLSSVMGFMWISGIIALVTDMEWLWYLFAACNALQGVFIFFSFTVSERTRKACMKALRNRKCSVSPTQTSSQPVTSV